MRWCFSLLLTLFFTNAFAQVDSIEASIVQKHLQFLAGDSLKGRGNYTPELQKAAYYIASTFKQEGAQFLPSLTSYFHPFTTKEMEDSALLPDSMGRYNPEQILLNVVGVLPGRSKVAEAVIFSAHYDGLGVYNKGKNIFYNGANDNASGTAALLTLMQYYAQKNDNERTLIFCAFAGEEIGLTGSTALADIIKPESVKAMINIEMIGRHGAVGEKSFFITGEYKSNLGAHFKKVLKEKDFRVKREPDVDMELFKRSDNYPFALKGVPAHTIMSSDDTDGCYHQTCDGLNRINVPNMVQIIQAIVTGSHGLIDGSFTPTRVRL